MRLESVGSTGTTGERETPGAMGDESAKDPQGQAGQGRRDGAGKDVPKGAARPASCTLAQDLGVPSRAPAQEGLQSVLVLVGKVTPSATGCCSQRAANPEGLWLWTVVPTREDCCSHGMPERKECCTQKVHRDTTCTHNPTHVHTRTPTHAHTQIHTHIGTDTPTSTAHTVTPTFFLANTPGLVLRKRLQPQERKDARPRCT